MLRTRSARSRYSDARSPRLLRPPLHQLQRVEPQRVDLDRLAAARRDHPVVDLRVHPRQLITLGALRQQPVALVHADAEARPAHMAFHDPLQRRDTDGESVRRSCV